MFDTSPAEALYTDRMATGWGGRWYGCHVAIVTDLVDPDKQGRIKVTLPWSADGQGERYDAWARVATMFAGNNRGSWFMPDVDDEVLVVFEGGDVRRPCVIGGLWNGADAPPASPDANNVKKVIRSRNGVLITIEDKSGQEQIRFDTPGGCSVTLKDGPGTIEVKDSNGNSVKLEAAGVTVDAALKVKVNATQVEVSAAMVTVNAGMSKFSGVVQADTVITNTIIAATYTPGAGNIL